MFCTGSAGTAVVTPNEALLFADGRYHNQAEMELGSSWTLMRQGNRKGQREGDLYQKLEGRQGGRQRDSGSEIQIQIQRNKEAEIVWLSEKERDTQTERSIYNETEDERER